MSDDTTIYGVGIDSSAAEQGARRVERSFEQISDASAKWDQKRAESDARVTANLAKMAKAQEDYAAKEIRRQEERTAAEEAAIQRRTAAAERGAAREIEAAQRAQRAQEEAVAAVEMAAMRQAAAQEKAAAAAGVHGLQLGRLRMELGTLIGRLTGTNTALDRMAGALGSAAVGNGAVIAAMAGIAAVAAAYHVLTTDAREATKAQEEALKALVKWKKEREASNTDFGKSVSAGATNVDEQTASRAYWTRVAETRASSGDLVASAAINLYLQLTKKQYEEHVAAIRLGSHAVHEETLKSQIERRAEQEAQLEDLVRSHTASRQRRQQLINDLKADEAQLATLRSKTDADSLQLAAKLTNMRDAARDALNPPAKRDADARKSDNEQRALLKIAETEERRVDAARALNAAAEQGKAAYERELHSQELQNRLLATEQAIRADFLDVNGKQRKGTDELMAAEIARAQAAIKNEDELSQHARATLAIQKDDSLIATLREKIAAYAGYAGAIKDAGDEEAYRARVEAANAVTDEEQRKKLLAEAATIRDLTADLHAAEAAHTARAQAAKKAAADEQKVIQETDRLLRSSFSTFFTDVFTKGKSAFDALFDSIRRGFIKLLADVAAARLSARFAGTVGGLLYGGLTPQQAAANGGIGDASAAGVSMAGTSGSPSAGYAATGVGGVFAGYGVGLSSGGNRGSGTLGGAAAGALTGAAIGSVIPVIGTAIGAVVGGLAGAVGGFLGAAHAAREAEKAMEELRKTLAANIASLQATIANDALGQAIAQVHAQVDAIRKQTEDAYAGGKNEAQRNVVLAQLNQLEAQRIQQLTTEAQLVVRQRQEDITVQYLRSKGQNETADALDQTIAKERELNALRKEGLDDATIAMQQFVTAAKAAADAAKVARDEQRATEDLNVRILRDRGHSARANDIEFQNAQRRAYQDAQDAGKSPAYLALLTLTQTEDAIARAEQLKMDAQIAAIHDAATKEQNQLDAQIQTTQDALKVAQDQLRAQEQAVAATQRVVDSLTQFSAGLKLNTGLTTLSPTQQLIEARKQYDDLLALANSGDKNAAGNLPGSANAYLAASRAVNASGVGYVNDFARVQSSIDAVTAKYGAQLTTEQQILAQLQQQNAALQAQLVALQAAKAQAAIDAQREIDAINNAAAESARLSGLFDDMQKKFKLPQTPIGSGPTLADMSGAFSGALAPIGDKQDVTNSSLGVAVNVLSSGLSQTVSRLDAVVSRLDDLAAAVQRSADAAIVRGSPY